MLTKFQIGYLAEKYVADRYASAQSFDELAEIEDIAQAIYRVPAIGDDGEFSNGRLAVEWNDD